MTSHQPGSRFLLPSDKAKTGGFRVPAFVSAFGPAGSRATARPSPSPDMIQQAISKNRGDSTVRQGGY